MAESAAGNYLESLFGLDGKVAIVSGSSAGLGKAIAVGLLRSGAKVILNGRNEQRAIEARDDIYREYNISSGLLVVRGDMSILEEAQNICQKAVEEFGRIDIIVNNAGINLTEAPFEEQSYEDWEKIANVNMKGPIHLTKCALPHLKNSPAGRIINLSSIGGHVGLPTNTYYTMTKGAMLMFTKSLAGELATTNITVNSISPGAFETPMNTKFTTDQSAHEQITASIPMRRMGQPKELVGCVIYLASTAGGYSTGSDILVDGGYTAV